MSTRFNARYGVIRVPVHLWGPAGDSVVTLALDTGATSTVIRTDALEALGYEPAAGRETKVVTGSGTALASRIALERVEALGCEHAAFAVIAHTLPTASGVDGVLGLDFLRGRTLTVDFRAGEITLA